MATFAEAEKLAQVQMSGAERTMAAASWRKSMAPYLERRVGPLKMTLEPEVAPATVWQPSVIAGTTGPARDRFVRSPDTAGPLPSSDQDVVNRSEVSCFRSIQRDS